MKVKRRFAKRCATLSGVPVRKLSMQMTSSPSARKRSHRCEPMKPAPPVIRMRGTSLPKRRGRALVAGSGGSSACSWLLCGADCGAADREVREAVLAHDLRLVDVAAVEDDRAAQEALHAGV